MPIIDMHAHYPMQLKMPGQPQVFTAANHLFNFEHIGKPRTTLDHAHQGRLRALASVLYYPKNEFLKAKQPFEDLRQQAKLVEQSLAADARFEMVHSSAALDRVITEGRKIAVFHCVEGAHVLAGREQVDALSEWGVAYVILAHLLYRNIGGCANAMPFLNDKTYRILCRQPVTGLTTLGKEICDELFRRRILVDITHCHDDAIDDVFEIAKQYPGQPVITSHTATRALNPAKLNISDQNILRIRKTGGIVGLIFFTHWLRTKESKSPYGLDLLYAQIDHIRELCGDFDNIAIGSDLDGFIKPLKGLEHLGKMGALAERLEHSYGQAAAQQILWGNALRTLKRGWGEA